jgi:hypothetical protein
MQRVRSVGHDLFRNQLRQFKEKEGPEVVILVADDPTLMRIIVAWTSLNVQLIEKPTPPPGESEREVWDWLWANTRYRLADLAERSGLTMPAVERRLKPLVGNRILYPDGTVNSFVQRYLRERVLKLFDAKPRRPAKSA